MNFFNDSFKSLKSALEEKINFEIDDEEIENKTTTRQHDTEREENLKKLVQHQNDEIELLRKQIFEYQQSKLTETRTLLDHERQRTSSSSQQQQQQNDSWFWEPETSSGASKEDGSPPEMADLTTIPLDANEHEVIDKLRQQIVERESKVKSLSVENAELNEKLKHLNDENQQLNKSIEELDGQHQVAMEKIIDVKKSLQDKNATLSSENEQFRSQIKSYHDSLDSKDAEKLELKTQLETASESNQQMMEFAKKYEQQIDELSALNLKYETELAELKNAPEQIAIVSNDECLRQIQSLLNTYFKMGGKFVDEEKFMAMLTKWMSSTASKLREMDFEISKLIDENKHIKDDASRHVQERDSLKNELINYEIECTELLKSNNRLMADIENLRTSGVGKLETIMENDGDDEDTDGVETIVEKSSVNDVDDNFTAIKSKLEATEVERCEFYDQIQALKSQLVENVSRCKSYQQEIENLENEKSNYLFELNELKSEEERNILQKELKCSKDREAELAVRLEEVEREREEISKKFNELQNSIDAISTTKESELEKAMIEMERLNTMKEQLNELESVKAEMSQKLRENEEVIQQLRGERDSLQLKCDELSKTYNASLENLQKSNEQVQVLQKKLLETSVADEMSAKISNLEESLKVLTLERDESAANFEKINGDLQQQNIEKSELIVKISSLEELISNLQNEKVELQKTHEKIQKSIANEFSEKISTLEAEIQSITAEREELQKLQQENTENLAKSNNRIQELEKQLTESSVTEELNSKITFFEDSIKALNKEKEDLVLLVTTKHNENIQYHNEILRLSQILQQEEANRSHSEEMNDQIKFLREKCDLLAQNLLQEQNNYRLLQQEKNDAVEMNGTLNKDIERLRQHLLEVADAYTFEQVSLQKQVEDYREKLMSIEVEAKQSATAYTSASIRANQQTETLQSQYNLLAMQRDELLIKLSMAEDKDSKNQAALTNLQVALEIFQRDKESDIELKTAALQKELEGEKRQQAKLHGDISQLQLQLQEAKAGLMAATRLSDQLELNQLTIDKLNNELTTYQSTIQSLRKQLEDSNANTSNADIDLIKNLILGYITAPNATAKTQILKLIANVLTLDDAECTRIGLKSSGGGLGGWFSRGGDNENNNVSLTEAFVSFLEKESQPRVANHNLLTIHENDTTTAAVRKISTSSSGSNSANVETPAPIMLSDNNTLLTSYNNRNSSSILKDILHDA